MQASFPTDNGAKGVWCQALIDSNIFIFIQAADVQVSAHEWEPWTWSRLDEWVIELPPVNRSIQRKSWWEKERMAGIFSIHEPGLLSNILINYVFVLQQNIIKERCNQQRPSFYKNYFCLGFLSEQKTLTHKSNAPYSLNISFFFSVCLFISRSHMKGTLSPCIKTVPTNYSDYQTAGPSNRVAKEKEKKTNDHMQNPSIIVHFD